MTSVEIRPLLTALDWSASDLARFLAVAEHTVYRWLGDRARPHGLALAALQALHEAASTARGRDRATALLRRGGAAALLSEALG